jgi:hypothetical protein
MESTEARMRLASFFCLLFALVGISAAQDTNFPVGPQYLLTGSPILARPIATPTLSLDTPLPPIPNLPEVGPPITDQPFIPNPELQEPNLLPIFYGYPMPSLVVLILPESPTELPRSIVEAGVTGMTDVQSLQERGYGVTLGESASFWKSHKPRAPRVYTNADVERLHGS